MTYLILTIILVLFGVGLLLAEMFLLPGFGIAGIFGLASLVAAVVIATPGSNTSQVSLCLSLTAIGNTIVSVTNLWYASRTIR